MALSPFSAPSSALSSAGRVAFSFLALSGLALAGCPIYSDRYYDEPAPTPVRPVSNTCSSPDACPGGQTCAADGRCYTQTCAAVGCVAPFVCTIVGGNAVCTSGSSKPDAGPPPFSGCRSDGECASKGAGAKCLSGVCTAQGDQCSDATQCRTNQLCVNGACTAACSANNPCPTGFSCDTGKGVCTGNPAPCQSGLACGDGKSCVEGHCVTTCGTGGTCPTGLICVDGGCTPDERPIFSCAVDGEPGTGEAGKCAQGSVCLRRSCYISCDPQDANACVGADTFNLCKPVTTTSGAYNVCGSSSNLGAECDVAQGRPCAGGLVCVDGFCR
jgi:hypothetical protein